MESLGVSVSSVAVTSRSSARRWRFASGFLFFGALTVVAGYYVPLRREAAKLRVQSASLERDLDQTRLELAHALTRPREPAPAAAAPPVCTATAQSAALASQVEQRTRKLEAKLGERFAELLRAETLSVSSAGDRVSVAVSSSQLFAGGSLELSASGRKLWCELSRSILEEFDGQLRVTGYYGKPRVAEPALLRRFASPWELSAARAARAVDVLVRECKAPAERFLVVGYGPRAAGALGENVAFEFIWATAD
jgi:chemotaxis protein MotB